MKILKRTGKLLYRGITLGLLVTIAYKIQQPTKIIEREIVKVEEKQVIKYKTVVKACKAQEATSDKPVYTRYKPRGDVFFAVGAGMGSDGFVVQGGRITEVIRPVGSVDIFKRLGDLYLGVGASTNKTFNLKLGREF